MYVHDIKYVIFYLYFQCCMLCHWWRKIVICCWFIFLLISFSSRFLDFSYIIFLIPSMKVDLFRFKIYGTKKCKSCFWKKIIKNISLGCSLMVLNPTTNFAFLQYYHLCHSFRKSRSLFKLQKGEIIYTSFLILIFLNTKNWEIFQKCFLSRIN